MHMADALLSPAVGLTMTAVSVAAVGYSVKKISAKGDDKIIPMMGVMGALVFAGQMINFTIPGTGSSGHIGGGILLAALLGPFPALLTVACVLLIQCLMFADGGLLAYGCNLFNLGVCASFIAYPLIFKPTVKRGASKGRIVAASVLSVVAGLQIGSFGVVAETSLSGIAQLPFGAFLALMQPIHLAIGIVEGIVTAAVLCFVQSIRPELLEAAAYQSKLAPKVSFKAVMAIILVITAVVAGGISIFASSLPDGLEWSIERITGSAELESDGNVHAIASDVVDSTALMPDYGFDGDSPAGTAAAGLTGSLITVLLAGGAGAVIYMIKRRKSTERI